MADWAGQSEPSIEYADPIRLIEDLGQRGSLFLTRPAIMHYMAKREDLVAGAGELFDVIAKGVVANSVSQTFPLHEAAAAHAAIESRGTTGATILLPWA